MSISRMGKEVIRCQIEVNTKDIQGLINFLVLLDCSRPSGPFSDV